MTNKVKPIPDGFHSITPYLCVRGAKDAIEFYKKAFGAKDIEAMTDDKTGKVCHAEFTIGNSIIMLAEEYPEMNFLSPQSCNGGSVMFKLYVEDCDSVFNQAVALGATVIQPLANQFYGDRSGSLKDPFGHVWYISTHIEDMSMEECHKRAEEHINK